MEEVVGSNPTRSTKSPFIADKLLGSLSICGRNLFALGFSLGMAALGGGVFNFRVDLATHQESKASHVKPDHQNDHGQTGNPKSEKIFFLLGRRNDRTF